MLTVHQYVNEGWWSISLMMMKLINTPETCARNFHKKLVSYKKRAI